MTFPPQIISSPDELTPLADQILRHFPRGGVVGLSGMLGAGKTTFVRAFLALVSEKMGRPSPKVTSPTYVFHQSYSHLKPPVDHFDLYRLESALENTLVEIGYFHVLEQRQHSGGFVFVEWPERVSEPKLLELNAQLQIGVQDEKRVFHFQSLT